MGFLAGNISKIKNESFIFKALGAICGMYAYCFLYLTYSFIKNLGLGSAVGTAWADVIFKAPLSFANGTIAIIVSLVLASTLKPILEKSGVYKHLSK